MTLGTGTDKLRAMHGEEAELRSVEDHREGLRNPYYADNAWRRWVDAQPKGEIHAD